MSEFRFDGRVAIVTGAGRGIGRAHALLLAERGAKVIVNDLGGSKEGFGADSEPAESVVKEIVAAGGVAVADTHDVGIPEGGKALVDAAIAEFGQLDILVNNAGISVWADPFEVDAANLERTLAVHVGGSFHTTIAAWPHMVERQYGRVVMTTSSGMFGLRDNITYATAKGGVIGLSRSLAVAGADAGIKVNLIAPAAATRRGSLKSSLDAAISGPPPEYMATEWVSPMMAYLAHEECNVTGEIYGAGAGRFTRIFIAENPGYARAKGLPTIEDVAQNWETINDLSDYYIPKDLLDWSAHFMSHQGS